MVERVRVVVLVVRVGVGVRHRAGGLVRQRVSVGGSVSLSPVRAQGPGLVRGPGVRQGEGLRQVSGSPGLATTTSLHADGLWW